VIKISKYNSLAIATDLDGTLLSSKNEVSAENLAAMRRLNSAGIKIILLTGRTFYEIPEILRKCGSIDYMIYSNGAAATDGKATVFGNCILHEKAVYLFELFEKYETFIEIYADGVPYVSKDKFNDEAFNLHRIDKGFIPEMHISRRPVPDLSKIVTDPSRKFEMFDVFFKNESERLECTELLKNDGEIEVTSSMTSNLEIFASGSGKGKALERLCGIVGIPINRVVITGDSKNDISAFQTSAKKYAVSNACPELKMLADKIICSNDENIMSYLEKEIL
jgi:Cof subfamily protein (haloacid dehalogenase superfamily)